MVDIALRSVTYRDQPRRVEMEYIFDWDPKKATLNVQKHGVRFEGAAATFLDARAISIPDDDPDNDEERWVTMGIDGAGRVLIVVHTFEAVNEDVNEEQCRIRLISARKATRKERGQYSTAKR